MDHKEIKMLAESNQQRAIEVMRSSGIPRIWEEAGCRVNVVGSLKMGLLVNHHDIDLHTYSSGITEASSFAIASRMAELPEVKEITCINGLHTEEHCIAWHVKYGCPNGEIWKFDIIHIEEGTEYDGFFEMVADRIVNLLTTEERKLILHMKYASAEDVIKGVDVY